MQFQRTYQYGSYLKGQHYFQEHLTLRNEVFAIQDDEITYQLVQSQFQEISQRRQFLFKKIEDFIELGVLQAWTIQLAEKSMDKFFACVKNHEFQKRFEIEDELYSVLKLLVDIQRLFSSDKYGIICQQKTAQLDNILLKREQNLLQIVIQSENWKINYIISKYLVSLVRSKTKLDKENDKLIQDSSTLFSLHQNILANIENQELKYLNLSHFLPEYFDPEYDNAYEAYACQEMVFNCISNSQEISKSSDFAFNEVSKVIDLTETTKLIFFQELITRKLQRTQNQVEERVFLCLSYLYIYQQYQQGYLYENNKVPLSLWTTKIPNSICCLKLNEITQVPSIITDFLIKEILESDSQFIFYISYGQLKKMEQIKQLVDIYLKPADKMNDPVYISCILRTLANKQQDHDIPVLLCDLLDQQACKRFKQLEVELAQEIQENILGNVLKGDYKNVMLVYLIEYTESTKNQLSQVYIQLFELHERNEFLDSVNLQSSLHKDICESLQRDIFQKVAHSSHQVLLDYVYFHFIEKNCPYGYYFVANMIFRFEEFFQILSLTQDTALKLLKILQRSVNEYQNTQTPQNYQFIEEIFNLLSSFFKKQQLQAKQNDLIELFFMFSFYINNPSNILASPFDLEDILDCYERRVLEKMNKIKQQQQNDLMKQLTTYACEKYQISRTLLRLDHERNIHRGLILLDILGKYFERASFEETTLKIKKSTFQRFMNHSLSLLSSSFTPSKDIAKHLLLIENCNLQNFQLVDEDGKNLNGENIMTSFLELFEQFLNQNHQILKVSIQKQTQQLSYNNNYFKPQDICESQDYEESKICSQYSFMVLFASELIKKSSENLKEQTKEVKSSMKKILITVVNLYDIHIINKILAQNIIQKISKCSYEQSMNLMNDPWRKLQSYFLCDDMTVNINKDYHQIELIPQFFFDHCLEFLIQQPGFEPYFNEFISLRFGYTYKQDINLLSEPPINIEDSLHASKLRLFGKESSDTIDSQVFLKGWNHFQTLTSFLQNLNIQDHPLASFSKSDQNTQLQKRKSRSNTIIQKNLLFTNNLEEILSDLVAFQEYSILLIQKYNSTSNFADDDLQIFVSQIVSQINSNSSKISLQLMILANSKNKNYMISKNNMPLIIRYMFNSFSLDQLFGNRQSSLAISEVLDNFNNYFTSFSQCIDEYKYNNLDFDITFKEICKNYEFSGSFLHGIIENETINHSSSTYLSIIKLIEVQFEMDFSFRKEIKRKQFIEQARKERIQENYIETVEDSADIQERLEQYAMQQTKQKKNFLVLAMKKISWLINNIDGIKDSFTHETFANILKQLKKVESQQMMESSPMETLGLNKFLDLSFSNNVQNKYQKCNMKCKQFYQNLLFFLKKLILKIAERENKIEDNHFIKNNSSNQKTEFMEYLESIRVTPVDNLKGFLSCQQEFIESIRVSIAELRDNNSREISEIQIILEQISQLPFLMENFPLSELEFQKIYDLHLDLAEDILIKQKILSLPKGNILFQSQQSIINEILNQCLTGLESLNSFVGDLRIDRIERLVEVLLTQQTEMKDRKELQSELVQYLISVIFIGKGRDQFKRYLMQQISEDIVNLNENDKKNIKTEEKQTIRRYSEGEDIKYECQRIFYEPVQMQKNRQEEVKKLKFNQIKDYQNRFEFYDDKDEEIQYHGYQWEQSSSQESNKIEIQVNKNKEKDEDHIDISIGIHSYDNNEIKSKNNQTIKSNAAKKKNSEIQQEKKEDHENKGDDMDSSEQKEISQENLEERLSLGFEEINLSSENEQLENANEIDQNYIEEQKNSEFIEYQNKKDIREQDKDNSFDIDADKDLDEDTNSEEGTESDVSQSSQCKLQDDHLEDFSDRLSDSIEQNQEEKYEQQEEKQIEHNENEVIQEKIVENQKDYRNNIMSNFRLTSSEIQDQIISKYAEYCYGDNSIFQEVFNELFQLGSKRNKCQKNKTILSKHFDQYVNESCNERAYSLKNPKRVIEMYESRNKFIQMSKQQIAFIQLLIDSYIDRVNKISFQKLHPIQENKINFIKDQQQPSSEYLISLITLSKVIRQLLKQFNGLLISQIITLRTTNISEDTKQFLPFLYQARSDQLPFLSFLFHIDTFIDCSAQDILLEIIQIPKQLQNVKKLIFVKYIKHLELISIDPRFLKCMHITFMFLNGIQFLQNFFDKVNKKYFHLMFRKFDLFFDQQFRYCNFCLKDQSPSQEHFLVGISLLENIIQRTNSADSLRLLRKMKIFDFFNNLFLGYVKTIYGKNIWITQEITFNSKYFFDYFDKSNIQKNLQAGTINERDFLDKFFDNNTEEDMVKNEFQNSEQFAVSEDIEYSLKKQTQINQIWNDNTNQEQLDILMSYIINQKQIDFEKSEVNNPSSDKNDILFDYMKKQMDNKKTIYSPFLMKEYYQQLDQTADRKITENLVVREVTYGFWKQLRIQLRQFKQKKSLDEDLDNQQEYQQEQLECQKQSDQFSSLSTSNIFTLIDRSKEKQDPSFIIPRTEFKVEEQQKHEEQEEEEEIDLYNSENLKMFGVSRKEFENIPIESANNFIAQKKQEYQTAVKQKKLESINKREQVLIGQLLGEDQEVIEQTKQDLQEHLQSKKFKSLLKILNEGEKRLMLISKDQEYLELLGDDMKKKSTSYYNKQKITRKIKNSQESQEKERKKSLSLFLTVKKMVSKAKKLKELRKNVRNHDNNGDKTDRMDKSLSIQLISEGIAMKILILSIMSDRNIRNDTCIQPFLKSACLNPFNYVRFLGLILLIASNIFLFKSFDIPWIDAILYEDTDSFIEEIDQMEFIEKDMEQKKEIQRKYLLVKCAEIIKYFLSEFSYGVRMLQFEEIILFREINKLEENQFFEDFSDGLENLKNTGLTNNIINEDTLDLTSCSLKNISLIDSAFPLVKNAGQIHFRTFEEFTWKLLSLKNIDKKNFGGELLAGEKYGQQKMNLNYSQERELLEAAFKLLQTIGDIVVVSKVEIQDKLKNQCLQEIYQQQQLLDLRIVNINKGMILKQSNTRANDLVKKCLEQGIKIAVANSTCFVNKVSFLNVLEKSIDSMDQLLFLSNLMFQEYHKVVKVFMDDIIQPLQIYQDYIKSQFNIDIIKGNENNPSTNELIEPIHNFFLNIFTFFSTPFMSSFCVNIKVFMYAREKILSENMIHHFAEYQEQRDQIGKQQAVSWWKQQEKQQRQQINEQIKVAWLEETTNPLLEIYQMYFKFIQRCLSLQEITEEYTPNYYDTFLQCPESLLFLFEEFYQNSSKVSDDMVDQNNQLEVLNEDQILFPVLKRDFSEHDEQELIPNIQRKWVSKEQKISISTQIEQLFEDILPLLLFSKNDSWQTMILKINYQAKSTSEKLNFIRIYSLNENKNRKELSSQANMSLTIDREQIWYSFLMSFSGVSPSSLITQEFDLYFKDEVGMDAGGISREFYSLAFKDLVDPNKEFFSLSVNGIKTQPNPYSSIIPDHLLHFQYAGRLVAHSILNNYCCEVDFTRSFLKQILGQQLYIADLEEIDPELSKNLLWTLENDISQLYLDFTYPSHQLGRQSIIELKPNGADIEVNEENKKEFITLMAEYIMVKQIQSQVKAFQQGFYEIIPFNAIKVLSLSELEFKISGERTIDIEEMIQHIQLTNYSEDSCQIIWLFEILRQYTQEELSGFIFFLTGSFRVPLGGFQNLNIVISRNWSPQDLPVAHTCSKVLELPSYVSKEIMVQKFEIALSYGAKGFFIE